MAENVENAPLGALSGKTIRELLQKTEPKDRDKRLVVSPILEPKEQLKDAEASIDVRLGFDFALVTASDVDSIDEFSETPKWTNEDGFERLYKLIYRPIGQKLVIHPHQFILASTLEYIRLPYNLTSYVVGRSTWGRLGLIVATAIGIHPKFAGTLTLELRNLGETPLTIYPGQTIAQLFFHWVDADKTEGATTGQYSGSTKLIPRHISSPKTKKVLGKLIDQSRPQQPEDDSTKGSRPVKE